MSETTSSNSRIDLRNSPTHAADGVSLGRPIAGAV